MWLPSKRLGCNTSLVSEIYEYKGELTILQIKVQLFYLRQWPFASIMTTSHAQYYSGMLASCLPPRGDVTTFNFNFNEYEI